MALLAIFGLGMLAYCYYHRTWEGIFLVLILASFLFIMNQQWYVSALSISLLLYSLLFAKKTSYTQLVVFSMAGSIVFAYFLLNFFLYNMLEHTTLIIISTLISKYQGH